jgi:hypothetical protein
VVIIKKTKRAASSKRKRIAGQSAPGTATGQPASGGPFAKHPQPANRTGFQGGVIFDFVVHHLAQSHDFQ